MWYQWSFVSGSFCRRGQLPDTGPFPLPGRCPDKQNQVLPDPGHRPGRWVFRPVHAWQCISSASNWGCEAHLNKTAGFDTARSSYRILYWSVQNLPASAGSISPGESRLNRKYSVLRRRSGWCGCCFSAVQRCIRKWKILPEEAKR